MQHNDARVWCRFQIPSYTVYMNYFIHQNDSYEKKRYKEYSDDIILIDLEYLILIKISMLKYVALHMPYSIFF